MWVFLTRRLRRWVLVAIVLRLARFLVHRLAIAANRRDPHATTSQMLQSADSTITTVSQRARGRRTG